MSSLSLEVDRLLEQVSQVALSINCEASNIAIDRLRLNKENLLVFLDLLLKWNKRVNLTSSNDLEKILFDHVLDSCIAVISLPKELPSKSRFLDVGSGAGFPGIVILLMQNQWQGILCEPRQKRAFFLDDVAGRIANGRSHVTTSRIEKICNEQIDVFDDMNLANHIEMLDFVITRATGLGEKFLQGSLNLVKPGGFAFIMSSCDVINSNLSDNAKLIGWQVEPSLAYTLPHNKAKRFIQVWKKL